MMNRQALRGAGTKTSGGKPARNEVTKAAGAGMKTDGGDHTGRGDSPEWRGEAVSSPPEQVTSSPEAAASRAEGNGPVPAEVAARDPNPGTYTEKGPARRPRADDPDAAENEEEKRQSAAEDHAAQSSRHPPYGRL